jgi:hypothetical protein
VALFELQKVCLGKKINEDLQSTKNTDTVSEKIHKAKIIPIEIGSVIIHYTVEL